MKDKNYKIQKNDRCKPCCLNCSYVSVFTNLDYLCTYDNLMLSVDPVGKCNFYKSLNYTDLRSVYA